MSKKWISIISLALAAVMLLTVPMMAWAEEPTPPDPNSNPIQVRDDGVFVQNQNGRYVENEELSESRVLEGDLTVEKTTVDSYAKNDALSIIRSSEDNSTFTVNGGVDAEAFATSTEGRDYVQSSVNAIKISTERGSTTTTINGDVTATSGIDGDWSDAYAYGLSVENYSTDQTNVIVEGGVTATATASDTTEGDSPESSRAYAINVAGSGSNNISVDGDVSAIADTTTGSARATGIQAGSSRMGSNNISVDGDVSAIAETTTGPARATGIQAGSSSMGSNITVDGSVSATSDTLTGDASATGIDVGGGFLSSGVEEGAEQGNLTITVVEDVYASATTGEGTANAIGISVSNSVTNTDIFVGGTVSGDTAAVLLNGMKYERDQETGTWIQVPSTVIGDNVSLTVWEIAPNEDGDYVVRRNYDQPPEGEEQKTYKSIEESELKAIQYIIKVQAGQEDIISTEGTSSYTAGERTYDVAHEGDSVTLKLNVPAGYEIDGAYGDEGQSWSLTKDANGNYYLTVPRGGGVMLSVKLAKLSAAVVAKTPEPERVGGPVWGDVLVTVTDKSGNATMEFLKDGTFRITGNNGSFTKGRFWFLNKLINVAENGDEDNATQITLNDASKMFELSMNGFSFELTENEIKVLAGNRTASR